MHTIFSFGLATDKFAMGSGEPLDTPAAEDADTQESDTIVIDGPDKPIGDAPAREVLLLLLARARGAPWLMMRSRPSAASPSP